LSYFEERFGIPLTTFAGYSVLERRKTYALVRDSAHLQRLASLKVQTVGLPILRKMGRHIKPTTAALQRFGHLATQHRLELSATEVRTLLQDGELALRLDYQPGYLVLLSAGHVLGCGLYLPDRLCSQIPHRQVAHQRLEPA
jgi:hypothetical protein